VALSVLELEKTPSAEDSARGSRHDALSQQCAGNNKNRPITRAIWICNSELKACG